jgi:hypothetical protein
MHTFSSRIFFCVAVAIAAITLPQSSEADVIGYVNIPLSPGVNFLGNPFTDQNGNYLDNLIPTTFNGAQVSLWNSTARTYSPVATYTSGVGWNDSASPLQLPPGLGFEITMPSSANLAIVGKVLDFNGNQWNGNANFTQPSPFTGPNGLYLLSSVAPVALGGGGAYPEWNYIVGRNPNAGESVWTYNQGAGNFDHTTYTGVGWDNGAPSLAVGHSAFFNIGGVAGLSPVPEPGTISLLMLGATAVVCRKVVRRKA